MKYLNSYNCRNIVLYNICLFLSLSTLLPVQAQTSYTTQADIKSETKRNKKEAARYESEYKESHLNVSNRKHKIGSGRKQEKPAEEPAIYSYDKEINAITEEPTVSTKKKKKLFQKKKKD